MSRHRLRFRRVVAILLLALFAAMPAIARTLVFKHFDAQIHVHPDGAIDVTEVIEAQFTGAWHGIYRTIPVEYTNDAGLNYTLLLDQISATDSDGQSLKLEQNREGRNVKFKIYVPAAEDATRTILLHYRVLDALRFFQDHDELYWNVTGNDWDRPDRTGDGAHRTSRGRHRTARHRIYRRDRLAHGRCARRDQQQRGGHYQHAQAGLSPRADGGGGLRQRFRESAIRIHEIRPLPEK